MSCQPNRTPVDIESLSWSSTYSYLLTEVRKTNDPIKRQHLTQEIIKLKKRATPNEDPGAMLDAMALLKTTKNGETYQPGYLIKELKQAELRNSNRRTKQEPLPWIERGPGNVSGRGRAIVVDPTDDTGNTWWVASIGGGVWKTSDAGVNWENKTPDLGILTTTTLVIAPSNPDVMYVGTGMGYGRIVDLVGSGIWKSTDHGETWIQLENTANGELLAAINRIVVDPENEDILLACSNGLTSHLGPRSLVNGPFGADRKSGIFKSIDGGNSWNQVFDPDEEIGTETDNRVQQIITSPTSFDTLYASVNEVGVIKSTDAGETWEVKSDFTIPGVVGVPQRGGFGLSGISMRSELAIARTDANRLYAAVERPVPTRPDLYMSKDAGETWVDVSDTGNDPNWFATFGADDRNSGWFNNTILVHPFDKNIVFVGGVSYWRINVNDVNDTRSTTPVNWWTNNNQGLPFAHADHHFSTYVIDDEQTQSWRLLETNDGGMAISPDDGATWTQISGMETTQFYGVDKKPGENVYIGGMQDNGSYMSGADATANSLWTFVLGGDGFEALFNANNGNLVLGTSQNGTINRSTDGGLTWALVNDPNNGIGPFITKLATTKADPELVFAVGQLGVSRSEDFGASWTNTSIQGGWLGFRPFDNVEVSLANPQVVWISSRIDPNPADGVPGGIHVSTDSGLSFEEISANFPEDVMEASGLATHPTDRNTAYFLFSVPGATKILRTTDLGLTFEDLSGYSETPSSRFNDIGFPDVGVFDLLVMPFDENIMWAGTEIGIVTTSDGGESWELMDEFPKVATFQINLVDQQIVVATQGRGIWSVDLPELVNYEIPTPETLTPRLLNAALTPTNQFKMTVDLRSSYDSTQLIVNGEVALSLGLNEAANSQDLILTPESERTATAQIISFKNGEEFKSATKEVFIYPVETVQSFSTNFSDPAIDDEFVGNGFSASSVTGFSNGALHSTHPYPLATDLIYQIKDAIQVSDENSFVSYRDVALIETGPATTYTDPNFFDFVILEGTSDGSNWKPLLPGYDASFDNVWNNALSSNPNVAGNESMYVNHRINLSDSFNPGDTIFVRLRLFSDPGLAHWGWAVDDLNIQDDDALGFSEDVLADQLSFHVYPNPVGNITTIEYYLPNQSVAQLKVFDINGRLMENLILNEKTYGISTFNWNTDHLPQGVYILHLQADKSHSQFRVLKQ